MKHLSKWILHRLGWTLLDIEGAHPASSIICVAPHTSNCDFFLGKLYYWAMGRKAGFLMKKEWFFFPLGFVLRAMGGVPINRSRSGSTVSRVQHFFSAKTDRHIAITPEGTRKQTERWHKGFWHIAKGANVPIQLAVIDYKKKELGIFEVFHPTDDPDADLAYIQSKYHAEQARFPEKFAKTVK
ncbi:acyltransferase [Porphyromonas macacae]|uniref:1-acylglycerol-3-phosphate O-acyltransferases n=1 Tax=Porphyromonas macacae TaxID=28115 RepID=A0A379EBL8_9PORP|nr:1-acyl-sn-glycerol-3-phosphate acyltransferase [Porphyromonas macacae]KGN99666.1 acyltransferase [Porphyromonas macacae]SUB89752.1 1-acylglycerol-3-phosphate O-acyltransferases [Porphyromonas macacae]